jgi:hypothetical protein
VWLTNRQTQATIKRQLQWEAEVVEYVDYMNKLTSVHGNAKAGTVAPSIRKDVPLLGPRFVPPSYLHLQKRDVTPAIEPDISYLVPLVIIHPFYHSGLTGCPRCGSTDTLWDGWTSTGARDVHGLCREERALGVQLRCKPCKAKYGKGGSNEDENQPFCFATTSKVFWKNWEHWKMPRQLYIFTVAGNRGADKIADNMPYFFTRCAVTRELFNVIVQFRPTLTSSGLEEHVKRKKTYFGITSRMLSFIK